MEDSVAFQKSLPYQFRQLLHELNAVATPGGQGVVIWRGFKPIATLSVGEAASLTRPAIRRLRSAFASR